MVEKEYAVIVKRGVNLAELDAEMSATYGVESIPNRTVEIANPRLGSNRITHWYLTDEEARELENDPRIEAVELPPDQRDDIEIGFRSYQEGTFYRGFSSVNDVNWGLRRSIETTNVYGSSRTVAGNYDYVLDGSGVDIVIMDSGIQPGHPEWESSEGTTRLVQIDWYGLSGLTGTQSVDFYRDRDGHGTHCAGIAAGKTYGWAKGAAIYSMKLQGLETPTGTDGTGIPIADAFDAIRLWHLNKVSGRPTVVNMSWGYLNTSTSAPTGGTYQGTPWTYSGQSDADLLLNYGIMLPLGGTRIFPAQNAFSNAEVEDMIDAGIHITIAAGNDYYKADLATGTDYNNFANFDGSSRLYHRPGSPYSDNAFFVGNIDSTVNGSSLDQPRTSSKKGPAVNIWAPGESIMSTSSNEASGYTTFDYPGNSNYKIMSIGGTSMAAPQVAGLLALHLQANPRVSPAYLKNKLLNDAKSVVATTGLTNDYNDFRSLMGSTQRIIYSRYGVTNPYNTVGSMSYTGIVPTVNDRGIVLSTSAWLDDNGTNVTVSSIVSGIAIQVTAVFASSPATPFNIQGRNSGASTTVSNVSANTGTVLELDVNNSFGFLVNEPLDIIA